MDNIGLAKKINEKIPDKIWPKKNKDINFLIKKSNLYGSLGYIKVPQISKPSKIKLSEMKFTSFGNDKNYRHYKDILNSILFDLYARTDEIELKQLLKEIYKVKSSPLNDKKVPPILLKVAPDITNKMVEDIINLALKYKIDGLIIGNTTISRPSSLQHHSKNEAGGLSGKPLFELSTKILAKFYILSEGRINLIGSGGVDGVETAYAKIKAGATLIQVYTGLMYRGPELFRIIFDGLGNSLREDGFANIKDT